MNEQQLKFLAEYEALCHKFKMHIASNMHYEMVLFDYNEGHDSLLQASANNDIRLHVEEIRNTPLEG